jgi:hypothetical protein
MRPALIASSYPRSCGEGIYPRWAAQQPPGQVTQSASCNRVARFGAASRPSGDKSPRHRGLCVHWYFLFAFRFFASRLAPTFSPQRTQPLCPTQTLCGSELARDEASKPNIHVTEPPPSRASSLPHWIFSSHNTHIRRSHRGIGVRLGEPGRLSGRLASKLCSHRSDGCTTGRARSAIRPPRGGVDVDLSAPLTTLAERRHCAVGIPA